MDIGDDVPPKPRERLEIEDEDDKQERIRLILENLNSSSATTSSTRDSGLPRFDFGDRKTYEVPPPSELLSRVQAFLPQIADSNNALSQRAQEDPSSVDIEHIEEGTEGYIEMNLGLGVFENKTKRDSYDEEMSSDSSSDSSDSSGMDEDDPVEGDCNTSSDASSEIITCFVPSRPIKPLPRRSLKTTSRPEIVVLKDES